MAKIIELYHPGVRIYDPEEHAIYARLVSGDYLKITEGTHDEADALERSKEADYFGVVMRDCIVWRRPGALNMTVSEFSREWRDWRSKNAASSIEAKAPQGASTYVFVQHERTLYIRCTDGTYGVSWRNVLDDDQALRLAGPLALVNKLYVVDGIPRVTFTIQTRSDRSEPPGCEFLSWYEAKHGTTGASLAPLKQQPPDPPPPTNDVMVFVVETGMLYFRAAGTNQYEPWRYYSSAETALLATSELVTFGITERHARLPGLGIWWVRVGRGSASFPSSGEACSFVRWYTANVESKLTVTEQAQTNITQAADHLVRVIRDDRPGPDGPCAFCGSPANHWGSPWPLCAEAHCSAANHFHEERCARGGVDTPETRTETLVFAKRWLEDKSEEEAKQKPEGSCAFCSDPAELPNAPGTPLACRKHERAGWHLHSLLELGGVCDTQPLREEVLRKIDAADQYVRDSQRDAAGARTEFDQVTKKKLGPSPGLHESTWYKPPPEEIPLVGTTPHYEWP